MSDWQPLAGRLAARVRGEGHRIVFVHGFTQTGGSWTEIADHVAHVGYQVVTVDLPGHGESAHIRADLRLTADLLAATTGPATYVGYSLGGRVCLHLALMYPHIVERLVLLGATAGIVDDGERATRRDADDRLAAHIAEIGVDAFVREWVAQPLFDGMVPTERDLAERATNTVDGLTTSLRLSGTGTQVPMWDRLHELNLPVLTLAGERDTKFLPLARQIAELLPRGTHRVITDAGHAAHLQQPDQVTMILLDWFEATAGQLGG